MITNAAEKQYTKMYDAYNKYKSERGKLERLLKDKINFEFSVVDLQAGVFGILDVYSDTRYNASFVCRFADAIHIIKNKGLLTSEDVREVACD